MKNNSPRTMNPNAEHRLGAGKAAFSLGREPNPRFRSPNPR